MNWTIAFQVARFVIWLVLNIRNLVLQAEEEKAIPGAGAEKFAAVKKGIVAAAKVAGMADKAIDAAMGVVDVDKEINEAVAKEINGSK